MNDYHDNALLPVRIGYIPLVDCAPLVVAQRLGLDRKHGLQLQLQRQASWAAVRDKLLSGELDAAHALAGLVYGVELGIGGVQGDLAVLMTLNHNGQGIVLSSPLADALQQGQSLRAALATRPRRPVLAQTFPTGTHAMWLYYWLAAQGVDPLRDIDSITLPPSLLPQALADGVIDGFCAGQPWASQPQRDGSGRIVIDSGTLWPGHPEKVLVCRRAQAALDPHWAVALTATLLEACRWLDQPGHAAQVAPWLAQPEIIDWPVADIAACLLPPAGVPAATALAFHDHGRVNVPRVSDGRWFLKQFQRWGWLAADSSEQHDARLMQVHRLDTYQQAAAQLGVALPVPTATGDRLFDGSHWPG